MIAEDVKFTVEQNLKPDAQGGSAPFFRAHLDRIETPDKSTVIMLGIKSTTWAVTKKVTAWPTLVYVPLENNYEYVS
jgi:hypothetical protein